MDRVHSLSEKEAPYSSLVFHVKTAVPCVQGLSKGRRRGSSKFSISVTSSLMRPPMQPLRFIAAAPAAATLLLFNVPSLWLLGLGFTSSSAVDLFDSRLPECQPRCSAKWLFRFREGAVSSSSISLFKPSGKPRNSNRRHKKNAQIRPTKSNFHFLVGTFQKHSSFLLVEVHSHGIQ